MTTPYEHGTDKDLAEWLDKRAEVWGIDIRRFQALAERLGVSLETILHIQTQAWLHDIAEGVYNLKRPTVHPDCKACQQEKEFHEAQFEHMKLVNKHIKEEHGKEEWE